MLLGYDTQKCGAKTRQTGAPCQDWAVPFTEPPRCRRHGGNHPASREKARRRINEYLLHSPDPKWMKQYRLKQWSESNARWEMRRAKKQGPLAVAQLLAHRAAEKAEKAQIAEANARARAQIREAWKRDQDTTKTDRGQSFDERPRYLPYDNDFDWDL